MKVLFTASTFSHIRNFHLPYLRWFREQGAVVHVACGGVPMEIPYADEIMALPFEKRMLSPKNFAAARLLRRKIQAEGYDLISTHTSLAAFFTRLAVKGLKGRPKVLNMVHGYLFDDETPALKRRILLGAEQLTAAETDLLLTMNAYDHALAERYRLGRQIAGIPGVGVDFTRFDGAGEAREAFREKLGLPEGAFALLYPAEFSRRKSQGVLLEAMKLLPEHVFLLLPGSGELLEVCRAQAERLGVGDRVLFPGQVEDMASWCNAADAAVTASRSEGLPFNVMEAMHRGLPVAASAVKGHTDLIRHGENGLLCPYGDPAAFAACIRSLLESAELRHTLGGRARADAEAYGLPQVFPAVTGRYKEVLEGKIQK